MPRTVLLSDAGGSLSKLGKEAHDNTTTTTTTKTSDEMMMTMMNNVEDNDDDDVVERLTYPDAAHSTDALTGASPIVCLALGLAPTLALTRPARLGCVLESRTRWMVNVRSTPVACSPPQEPRYDQTCMQGCSKSKNVKQKKNS